MPRSTRLLALPLLVAGLPLAGCGTAEDYPNAARPAIPQTLTGAVDDGGLSIDPAEIGAGALRILVANQTDRAVALRFERSSGGGDDRTETQAINPGGTGRVSTMVVEGEYELRAVGAGADPVQISIGPPRESSSQELLIP